MRDQYTREENAGQSSMESLFANTCAEANVLECKNDIGFSSFDTVVSNSCAICFAFTNVFSVCLLSAVYMDLFLIDVKKNVPEKNKKNVKKRKKVTKIKNVCKR